LPQPTGLAGFYRQSLGHHDLVCDGVPPAAIAAAEGTPVYVYSAAVLRERYRAIDTAFDGYPHAVHYALKANSTLAVARLLRELGSAVDANSVWEIEVARKAGFGPSHIVFTGVGKTPAELECAVALGVKAINVESAGELARLEAIATRLGRTARVAVRVNPDIDAKSHPHISTGLKINKFGVPIDDARALLQTLTDRPSLALVAIHVHVGSQITTLEPLRRAAALAADVSIELRQQGFPLDGTWAAVGVHAMAASAICRRYPARSWEASAAHARNRAGRRSRRRPEPGSGVIDVKPLASSEAAHH
jgi:diaminopimelate decarboxylase